MSVRDTIRRLGGPKIASVNLNGSKVYVRSLSGEGRSKYTHYVEKAKENGGLSAAKIASFGICEEDGTLAYDTDKPEDIAELESRDGEFLQNVGMKLFEISGLAVSSAEEAAKNSEASPNSSSGSSSPATSSTQP